MDNELAPIVLFVYNRPWHTRQVLDALALNKEAEKSVLYIFCDGPKDNETIAGLSKINEVRDLIVSEDRFKLVNVNIQKSNKGLASSIIDGVTEILNNHETVIVLEDDIVTSSGFLKFMNDALLLYKNNEKVMHISGFMFPHEEILQETFFFNVPLCWGWATWKRSWSYFEVDSVKLWKELHNKNIFKSIDKFGGDYLSSQLAHNISGKLKTWFIKWHATVLLKNGYTLYPNKSLVDNIGFDNTGVHNEATTKFKNSLLLEEVKVNIIEICEDNKAKEIVQLFYENLKKSVELKATPTLKKRIKNKIKTLFFSAFPEVKKLLKQRNEKTIVLKHNSYFGEQSLVYPTAKLSNSIIGNYSYVSQNSIINNTIIGKFCSIGPNFISGWGIHPTNGLSTHPMFYSTKRQNGITYSKDDKIEETRSIVVGNDVFIGMNVTLLDGVNIGDGAVIGAGAVVSKDIPPYAIAVGNPIKIIKYRFEDEKIKELLQIKWWDFEKEDLHLVEEYFFKSEEFIKEYNSL